MIIRVVEPLQAVEYDGQNAAEVIEVANRNGVGHAIVSQGNGTLIIAGDGSQFTIQVGQVLIGALNGWGSVLPRSAFDATFVEVGGAA